MEYKILRSVGEEKPTGNLAIENLIKMVNEHISEGWKPLGGVAVAPVVGPTSLGSQRENWFTSFTQAMIKTDGNL
jgi:hypothetical protein